MPKSSQQPVGSDIKILRSILWLGSIIAFLLLVNNILFIAYMVKSATMAEMLDLSRAMNATTGRTMAKAYDLMGGLEQDDITVIVGNVRSITTDVDLMLGPVAEHSNMSAVVSSVQRVAGAVDARALSGAVSDAATIIHNVDAEHVRIILDNILNATAELRKIVDGLAATHNVQLKF